MSLRDGLVGLRSRVRPWLAVGAVSVLSVVVLWLSDLAPEWFSTTVSAVVAGVLVEEAVRRRRSAAGGEPLACHASVTDADYVSVPGRSGEPARTVPASGHTVRLVVTASERTIVLNGLRVVVIERSRPRGHLSPSAGVPPVRAYTVLLDEDPPRLEPQGADTPSVFAYKVGPDDPEIFELRVETERWYVAWVLELDWVDGSRSGTKRIELAGQPFRTVARPPRGLSWEGAA